jgi:hypothetical protein
MNRCLKLAALSILALLLSQCQLLRKKKKPKPAATEPAVILIGRVEMVNDDHDFVLIQTQGSVRLPEGTELSITAADGAEARVKTSPERKGSFLTADIISGTPSRGEAVLWQRPAAAPEVPADEEGAGVPIQTPLPASLPSASITLPSSGYVEPPLPQP